MAASGSAVRTPGQTFALVAGVVYLIVGVVGFLFTGFDNFAAESGDTVIVFGVNPLHNIIHILVGALWVGGARSPAGAKSVNTLIGVVYLALGVLGIFVGDSLFGFINHNAADWVLHLVSGAVSLYFGTKGSQT